VSLCRFASVLSLICLLTLAHAAAADEAKELLRAGIIGADTSHSTAFAKIFNNPKAKGPLAEVRVVAVYPGGSPDIPSSRDCVPGVTRQLRKMGVEVCDSIDAMLEKVDVVLLESVDGRPHLAQAIPVFKAGKPVFIDKPVAGSLVDAIRIYRLAKQYDVPCFSSSALRYAAAIRQLRDHPPGGKVLGCTAFSPCHLEPHHPDLFWYGVHGVEILYTIMGPGCQTVARTHTAGEDVVVGVWKDGRIGTFRGLHNGRSYGAVVFGSRGVRFTDRFEGYGPLVGEIAKFFTTGKPPVSVEETLEIFAFMEAADESRRQGGAPVSVDEVMKKAEAAAVAASRSKTDEELFQKLTNDLESIDESERDRITEVIFERAERCPPHILFLGAGAAFAEKRLEDSAFLFYTAQLRARFERECFPPKDTGGNDPFLICGALSSQLGSIINPAVMAEPKVFEKAIARFKKWTPRAPKDYEPGYEYTQRKSEKEALDATAPHRAEFLDRMGDLATLLNDADYFAAFRVLQQCGLSPPDKRPTKDAKEKATETMKRIEKEKGLKGIFWEEIVEKEAVGGHQETEQKR